ncbi:MAG: tRNA uridine-5-carboxymethylaminomethyl(34) synthesis GTPase MnmE [Bdellovibrionaceae bacterium]|nr:tRNA uridine-5-carboxymethylaminomethyl(34) synthesis GTPase MnmE [Bdellovibrionales bacterium]MCB9085460.1 tRNA uridine-5-carboxymethylaminomethyl(34) synthesis GTPase MnmE [Pseudobdellovibrionaceae bacterium]
MGILARDHDTIAAVSTPPGVGGIAVVRISGGGALEISQRVCPFLPSQPESHRIYYGFAQDIVSKTDIDEVLVSYFAEGRSFTGEGTLEISCHGGTVVTAQLLQELIKAGARLAEPGEFTYRAFLNQRIDLVQAESVLGLIEANSKRSSRLALRQLKGELSKFLVELEDRIHWILAHLEANIDFAYEDIETASDQTLIDQCEGLWTRVKGVVASYAQGRMIHDGVRIAIVGRPNVGKSSLMNAFLCEDRSIVTDIAGTTRDRVEGSCLFNGVRINLVDTAGLRETQDVVESLGIERAQKALAEADLILLVVDLTDLGDFSELRFLKEGCSSPLWLFGNKSDRVGSGSSMEVLQSWWGEAKKRLSDNEDSQKEVRLLVGNTLSESGLNEFRENLTRFTASDFAGASAVLSNSRHFELFTTIEKGLCRAVELLKAGESPDLVAFELRDSLFAVHELIGKQFDDEVLDRVFKEFCLGK